MHLHFVIRFLQGMWLTTSFLPGITLQHTAHLLGLYAPLCRAIQSPRKYLGQLLWQGSALWGMLGALAGLCAGLPLLASGVHILEDSYPMEVRAFLFGSSFLGSLFLYRQVKRASQVGASAGLIGSLIAYLLGNMLPSTSALSPLSWGIVGLCCFPAALLPQVSLGLALLALHRYTALMEVFRQGDIVSIACFCLGLLLGSMLAYIGLRKAFLRNLDTSYAFLSGMLLSTWGQVWPWRYQVQDPHGLWQGEQAVSPITYSTITGQDPQWLTALLAMFLGASYVVFLYYMHNTHVQQEDPTGAAKSPALHQDLSA